MNLDAKHYKCYTLRYKNEFEHGEIYGEQKEAKN